MAQSDPSVWSQAPAQAIVAGNSLGGNQVNTGNSSNGSASLWRRLIFGKDKDREKDKGALEASASAEDAASGRHGAGQNDDSRPGLIRRVSRKVVPGLPRAQTFKRQQSELRNNLEAVQPTPAERRTVSMDRRAHTSTNVSQTQSNPRASAPDFLSSTFSPAPSVPSIASAPNSPLEEKMLSSIGELDVTLLPVEIVPIPQLETSQVPEVPLAVPVASEAVQAVSVTDDQSITTSTYDAMIREELEQTWILNLSMHFRDRSKREKFFVTYRQHSTTWRRVTISLDYREAPEGSLEMDLAQTKFQRDKSAKIYEAIRESLSDIQFYDSVTNLKLQTTEGRLHVHVVEDVNEIIQYPTIRMIQHMKCRRVREKDIEFDSHMSGFVYKVRVGGQILIKKEIPGPDTVDEFLYEINALNRLRTARNVIEFYGVIVDDRDEHVIGLLISYAEKGALIDVIYDHEHTLPWPVREKWARQIVEGLSEIHEAGFVQGDFTLSNIVIDENDDAKIIDINRRGCPVGWEPPEATPLIESGQRISMYIGVKSDLFQLGMVLWALATQDDEPEVYGRPLRIDTTIKIPPWFRYVVDICLCEDPRSRKQAAYLSSIFPNADQDPGYLQRNTTSKSVDNGYERQEYPVDFSQANMDPMVKTVSPPTDWSFVSWGNPVAEDTYRYPARGRSPPSPLPSSRGDFDPRYGHRMPVWSDQYNEAITVPSVSDVLPDGYEVDSKAEDEPLPVMRHSPPNHQQSIQVEEGRLMKLRLGSGDPSQEEQTTVSPENTEVGNNCDDTRQEHVSVQGQQHDMPEEADSFATERQDVEEHLGKENPGPLQGVSEVGKTAPEAQLNSNQLDSDKDTHDLSGPEGAEHHGRNENRPLENSRSSAGPANGNILVGLTQVSTASVTPGSGAAGLPSSVSTGLRSSRHSPEHLAGDLVGIGADFGVSGNVGTCDSELVIEDEGDVQISFPILQETIVKGTRCQA